MEIDPDRFGWLQGQSIQSNNGSREDNEYFRHTGQHSSFDYHEQDYNLRPNDEEACGSTTTSVTTLGIEHFISMAISVLS